MSLIDDLLGTLQEGTGTHEAASRERVAVAVRAACGGCACGRAPDVEFVRAGPQLACRCGAKRALQHRQLVKCIASIPLQCPCCHSMARNSGSTYYNTLTCPKCPEKVSWGEAWRWVSSEPAATHVVAAAGPSQKTAPQQRASVFRRQVVDLRDHPGVALGHRDWERVREWRRQRREHDDRPDPLRALILRGLPAPPPGDAATRVLDDVASSLEDLVARVGDAVNEAVGGADNAPGLISEIEDVGLDHYCRAVAKCIASYTRGEAYRAASGVFGELDLFDDEQRDDTFPFLSRRDRQRINELMEPTISELGWPKTLGRLIKVALDADGVNVEDPAAPNSVGEAVDAEPASSDLRTLSASAAALSALRSFDLAAELTEVLAEPSWVKAVEERGCLQLSRDVACAVGELVEREALDSLREPLHRLFGKDTEFDYLPCPHGLRRVPIE